MAQTQQMTSKPSKSTGPLNFKPLGNRVLVHRLAAEEKLKGGIILPDAAKKKQEKAEVVAIGTGKKDKNGSQGAKAKERIFYFLCVLCALCG